ncbi:MAG: hypothetical protein NC301_01705 [Bacteroides sp.]|nr:hypothetical protein [Bacteroides sp.]MCM1378598.1 hypothetical protein [Bacteroides sp.]MCM1444899.1 hypothetical protein [Prevotella sp.]
MTDADYENMSAFSCGDTELDNFFRNEVRECVNKHYLAAYSVLSPKEEIIAAFTLMNDALMIESQTAKEDFIDDMRFETEPDIVDFFKRQTSYPAINIGHLGTASPHQCKGIGMAIIELVANTFQEYKQAGCQFITVDALNNSRTTRFYLDNGFYFQTNKDFYSSTRRMYRILN